MTKPIIALLHTGTSSQLVTIADPALRPYELRAVYLPDFEPGALDDVDAVIVADRDHPALLREHADEIYAVAERGGLLVVFGENSADSWMPGVAWESRPTNFWWWRTGEDHGMRLRNPDHPIWEYFSEKAMIWHHHGIFRVPEGAVSLVAVEEEGVEVGSTTYYDRVSTAGEIFLTSMDPCFHHGAAFMPGATQLLYSTVRWVDQRARQLATDRVAAGSVVV